MVKASKKDKLEKELESFKQIWSGGYLTGYSKKRNQKGLEEYLKNNLTGKTILEIGCGGGQWSKLIYQKNIFDKIYCVDALSEEHNNFWENVGNDSKKNIEYYEIKDFNLDFIEDNSLDYVFSYDVFCHISLSGQNAYLKSLSKKCKKDAKLLIMYADPKKYLSSEPENRYHVRRYLPKDLFIYKISNKRLINDAILDCDGEPSEGRWYWVGIENFINICESNNFTIINKDLNIDKTNPITFFTL